MTTITNPLKDILCQVRYESMTQYKLPNVYFDKTLFYIEFSNTEFNTTEKVVKELRRLFPNDPFFNIVLI